MGSILKQIAQYLYIKKDKNAEKEKPSLYLRMMHGMNRISIIMFILAMLLLLYRLIFK